MGKFKKDRLQRLRSFCRRTIFKDLAFGLVMMVILIATIVSVATYEIISRTEEKRLQARANEYLDHLVDSLELPIWTIDHDSVNRIAASYFSTEQVADIRVTERYTDANGNLADRVLFARSKPGESRLVK